MASQVEELDASIRELESSLLDCPPELRAQVEQQIQNLRDVRDSLVRLAPEIQANLVHRAPLTDAIAAFFRPEPPAEVPAWLPDDLHRAAVSEPMMRPAPGVKVYFEDDSVGCAIPQGVGQIPIRQGLDLGFHSSTGRLAHQRFYEHGLLRWCVDYHLTGGRALVAFYAATERLSYPEHGLVTRFSPNGNVVSQGYFDRGTPAGYHKLWEDDGYPISATLYEAGRRVETILPDGSRMPG